MRDGCKSRRGSSHNWEGNKEIYLIDTVWEIMYWFDLTRWGTILDPCKHRNKIWGLANVEYFFQKLSSCFLSDCKLLNCKFAALS
jgi:hypothetical protein